MAARRSSPDNPTYPRPTTEPPPRGDCRTISTPLDLAPARGDRFGVDPERPTSVDLAAGTFTVTLLDRGRPASYPVWYSPAFGGHTFRVELPDLQLRITPGSGPLTICR